MIFNKRKETVFVHCPKCRKKLCIDADLKKAFCQYCGQPFAFGTTESQTENGQNSPEKKGSLETIFGFIERQQDRMETNRQKRKQEAEAERAKQIARIKKYWWLIALFALAMITIITVGIILE